MEKMKLQFKAVQDGLPEQQVQHFINTQSLPDFDLSNFKSRFTSDQINN